MSSGPILIVPACEQGRGGGHLSRSMFIFRALRERGGDAYLWIPEHLKNDVVSRFGEFFETPDHGKSDITGEAVHPFLSLEKELFNRDWDFIVLDRFRTPKKEYDFWAGLGPIIGIDEGGAYRKHFDFLIDLLPALSQTVPNLTAPALLPLPRKRRPPFAETGFDEERSSLPGSAPNQQPHPEGWDSKSLNTNENAFKSFDDVPFRILISFGAEDSADLGVSAAATLVRAVQNKKNAFPPEITLIASTPPGDNFRGRDDRLPGVRVSGKIPGLREHFAEYDLLITHFGLGAFEAVYSRLPVLLISPTIYHEKLSRAAGFLSLGRGKAGIRRLGNLDIDREFLKNLAGRGKKIAFSYGLLEEQKEDLASFVSGIALHSLSACPICEEKTGVKEKRRDPVLARFSRETFRRCKRCGGIYQSHLTPPPIEYAKDYFFDFYKKQYGKTYLEDFPNLVEMGRKRLIHIRALLSPKITKPSLLDIGCAYGPFLAAAAEGGFSPAGIEPAEDAVRYIKEELGFPAWQGFFPLSPNAAWQLPNGKPVSEGSLDVITLWYVIEHFEEPGKVLGEIHRLLKNGGVLAFSTPSFSGISGRKSLNLFLENSPRDHWTIWNPRICKKIFRKYGFRLCKIVISGHHPERFPFFGRFLSPSKKKGTLYRLLLLISRLFRLGDTFEAYGIK